MGFGLLVISMGYSKNPSFVERLFPKLAFKSSYVFLFLDLIHCIKGSVIDFHFYY